jgi:hypothetical protein
LSLDTELRRPCSSGSWVHPAEFVTDATLILGWSIDGLTDMRRIDPVAKAVQLRHLLLVQFAQPALQLGSAGQACLPSAPEGSAQLPLEQSDPQAVKELGTHDVHDELHEPVTGTARIGRGPTRRIGVGEPAVSGSSR